MKFKGKNSVYNKYFKRAIDIIITLISLVLFGWLLLILAIVVRIKMGSPVIFKQARPGLNEKIFYLYKFRSMTDKRDSEGNLLPDDMRLTKFGKLLRKTSLDELPELFNILFGHMSLVGPRPLLVEYLPYYEEKERHRHDVRPGLTGLAQVNGRNVSSWEERFEKDLYYVEKMSFSLDLKIILITMKKVIKGSDILVGKSIPAGRLDNYRKDK